MSKHPQTYKMASELEDSQDPHKPNHPEEAKHVLSSFGGETAESYLQVEGEDGHKVNDVQEIFDELKFIGWKNDTD